MTFIVKGQITDKCAELQPGGWTNTPKKAIYALCGEYAIQQFF
jgi:hypothetical protein